MTAPRPRNKASPQFNPRLPAVPGGWSPLIQFQSADFRPYSSRQGRSSSFRGRAARCGRHADTFDRTWATGVNTFNAPAGTVLNPGTTNFVHIGQTQGHPVEWTTSSSDDAAATGWSPSVYALNFQGSWSFPDSEKLKFRVNGRAAEPTINHLSEIRSAGPTLRLGAAAMNWPVVPLPSLSASNRFFIMIFNSNSRKREVKCKMRN